MNKTEYLNSLAATSFIQEVGTPVEQTNLSDDELKLSVYVVKVLERVNTTKAQPVKIRFAVYNEGQANETAFPAQEYKPFFEENDTAYKAVKNYVVGLSNIMAYWIKEWDKKQNYAKVRVFEDVGTSIEEKWLLVWRNDLSELTHKEITKTIG